MSRELFDFVWGVESGGYQWLEATEYVSPEFEHKNLDQPLPFLIASTRQLAGRAFNPLRDFSGLFRTFSEVEITRDGILGFANEYGLLGGSVGVEVRDPDRPNDPPRLYAEPESAWAEQIERMRQAIALWEMARARDTERLSKHIVWREGGVQYVSHPGYPTSRLPPGARFAQASWIATQEISPELLDTFTPGDLVEPALRQLQRIVNDSMRERIRLRLLSEHSVNDLALYMVPNSLVGALWLQLAQAIDGRKNFRRCETCSRWLEISPAAARKNRLFCSNACRSKAYRDRQAQAYALDNDGVAVRDIAKRLGSDAQTVRRWLRAKSKESRQ